jgi:EmrB/QacA subfamily drug resistance transporter
MILAVMCLCVILIIATVAAINVSVPKIEASNLHPSSTQLIWIVDLYVIIFAGLLFPSGAVGDRYGRKGALLAGLATYAVGSIFASLSQNIPQLLAARALMGIGAAFIMPTTLAFITQVFEGIERRRAISLWAACTAIGGGFGLLIGGAVSQYLDWQYLFWIGGGIGIVALILAAVYAPKTPTYKQPIDVVGAGLLVICFVALMYGIIEAVNVGWDHWTILTAFGVSILSMAIFIFFELRQKQPLLDPRTFKIPELRSGALGIATSFFAMFSLYFVNAQFLQYSKGYSPLLAGIAILPATASLFFFSRISYILTGRFGTKPIVIAGMLTITLGLLLLSLIESSTSYVWYALALIVVAVGPGISNPAMSDAIMESFPEEKAGIGSAINDTSREVGSALGIALIGTIVTIEFPKLIPQQVLSAVGLTTQTSVYTILQKIQALGGQNYNLEAAGRQAFANSIHVGFRISALVAFVVAVILYWWYPRDQAKSLR